MAIVCGVKSLSQLLLVFYSQVPCVIGLLEKVCASVKTSCDLFNPSVESVSVLVASLMIIYFLERGCLVNVC